MTQGGKRSGAGRKRGTPNKRSAETVARIEDSNFDPLQALIETAQAAKTQNDTQTLIEVSKVLLPYTTPRLKAQSHAPSIEFFGHSSDAGKIRALFTKACQGDVSPTIAAELAQTLNVAMRIEEMEDLKAEMESIKAILKQRKT